MLNNNIAEFVWRSLLLATQSKKICSGFNKATRKAKYQNCSYILMANNPEGDGNERKNNCNSFLAWNVVLGISSYRNVS